VSNKRDKSQQVHSLSDDPNSKLAGKKHVTNKERQRMEREKKKERRENRDQVKRKEREVIDRIENEDFEFDDLGSLEI